VVKSELKGMFHDLLALLKEHVYFSIASIATSNVSLVGENPLRLTLQVKVKQVDDRLFCSKVDL
jgi:hypothetical protein